MCSLQPDEMKEDVHHWWLEENQSSVRQWGVYSVVFSPPEFSSLFGFGLVLLYLSRAWINCSHSRWATTCVDPQFRSDSSSQCNRFISPVVNSMSPQGHKWHIVLHIYTLIHTRTWLKCWCVSKNSVRYRQGITYPVFWVFFGPMTDHEELVWTHPLGPISGLNLWKVGRSFFFLPKHLLLALIRWNSCHCLHWERRKASGHHLAPKWMDATERVRHVLQLGPSSFSCPPPIIISIGAACRRQSEVMGTT